MKVFIPSLPGFVVTVTISPVLKPTVKFQEVDVDGIRYGVSSIQTGYQSIDFSISLKLKNRI